MKIDYFSCLELFSRTIIDRVIQFLNFDGKDLENFERENQAQPKILSFFFFVSNFRAIFHFEKFSKSAVIFFMRSQITAVSEIA